MTKPGKSKQRIEQQQQPQEQQEQLKRRSQDATSTRAKGSAHKKVTADKWNQ
jgi:hypothetical protein